MNNPLISVVVPVYYEEKVVQECYRRLRSVLEGDNLNFELIFINDGSKDRTLEILENIAGDDIRVKVISFSRNFGHQIAITAGISESKGQAVVVIDADLQDPPELIPEMVKMWQQEYHVVYAKRKSREGETWFKLCTAKWFYRILQNLTDIEIPKDTGDFRLMDRAVVEVFKNMPEKNRFVRGMISWLGFKQIPIEYERKKRYAGETKYPLKKMLKFAADGIYSFSSKPIKLIGLTSICMFVLALIIGILFAFFGSFTVSNSSLLFFMLLTGGFVLLNLYILGQYVERIHSESIGRPLYIIERKINFEKEG